MSRHVYLLPERQEIQFHELKLGDVFTLLDDGPDKVEDGSGVYTAVTNPYQDDKGVWGIDTEEEE